MSLHFKEGQFTTVLFIFFILCLSYITLSHWILMLIDKLISTRNYHALNCSVRCRYLQVFEGSKFLPAAIEGLTHTVRGRSHSSLALDGLANGKAVPGGSSWSGTSSSRPEMTYIHFQLKSLKPALLIVLFNFLLFFFFSCIFEAELIHLLLHNCEHIYIFELSCVSITNKIGMENSS